MKVEGNCSLLQVRHLTRFVKKKENYAGSKTLHASIKEKETHWPKVP